jgi:hypothetical protein
MATTSDRASCGWPSIAWARRMQVSPDHLGRSKCACRLDGARVHAEFYSAQPEVRHALEASLPRLRDLLGNRACNWARPTSDSAIATTRGVRRLPANGQGDCFPDDRGRSPRHCAVRVAWSTNTRRSKGTGGRTADTGSWRRLPDTGPFSSTSNPRHACRPIAARPLHGRDIAIQERRPCPPAASPSAPAESSPRKKKAGPFRQVEVDRHRQRGAAGRRRWRLVVLAGACVGQAGAEALVGAPGQGARAVLRARTRVRRQSRRHRQRALTCRPTCS